MGWCSGTDVFDPVATAILKSSLSEEEKVTLLKALITACWNHDWDCENDSYYWDSSGAGLVMKAFRELSPKIENWVQEYLAEYGEQ